MKKIFIDGSAGTTGLRIHERLSGRSDIEIFTLVGDERKDPDARKRAINSCDIAFLCLPDDAAREAVSMIDNENVKVIDTSTAHRVGCGFAYGFAELSEEHFDDIKNNNRIAVPGCHASGFIALVYPLIKAGAVDPDVLLACTSLTGYSGGGKKMIAEYEGEERNNLLDAPRVYGLSQSHKHLKEMKAVTGIEKAPAFLPVVSDFYSGMLVTVPLFADMLKNGVGIGDIKNIYRELYNENSTGVVAYKDGVDEGGFMSAVGLGGKDCMEISVFGNDERILLAARYDNLGKGASGAAIECMNIALGLDPKTGLEL